MKTVIVVVLCLQLVALPFSAPFITCPSQLLARRDGRFRSLDQSRCAANIENSGVGKRSWLAEPDAAIIQSKDKLLEEAEKASGLVTPGMREDYLQNGVVLVKGAIHERWIKLLSSACATAQERPGPFAEVLHKPSDTGTYFTDLELAHRLEAFSAFSLYGPCAAITSALMCSTHVRFLYDQLFIKEQGVSVPTFWHQDQAYWRVNGTQVSSVFVPLDPVSAEDGLAFVVGSQHWPLHNPQNFADGSPYSGIDMPPMPDISAAVAAGEMQLARFELAPGDALVFSGTVAHGGAGNWGRALSTRWIGDDVTYSARSVMVPTGDVGLKDGEPLAGNEAAFPLVWPQSRR